jgi:hypothetical protein
MVRYGMHLRNWGGREEMNITGRETERERERERERDM